MKILLGSNNPSKKRSLELALKELNIKDFNIICFDVESGVHSKPIGFEIIRGADNRNQVCKKLANEQNIKYDYICGLEGGYSLDENGIPFIVTYSIIEDCTGKKSTGKSLGLRLSRKMFDYIRDGGSLNDLISDINNSKDNKKENGITGFLTGGLYKRDKFDRDAIVSALIPFIFNEKREQLNNKINETEV